MNGTVLKPCDILVFGSYGSAEGSIIGSRIKAREARPGEKVFAIHSELVFFGGPLLSNNIGNIKTAGTTAPRVFTDKDLISHLGDEVKVFRLKTLTPEQCTDIRHELAILAKQKWPYAYIVLVAMWLDYWVNRTVNLVTLGKFWPGWEPFASLIDGDVCSTLIARLFNKFTGVSFGDRPRKVSPHDIHKYCAGHPSVFELVWEGTIS